MSDPGSGWNVFDESGSYGLYRDGTCVLGLPGPIQVAAITNTTPELATLTDVRVEATGRLLGSRNALYGIMCLASSQSDYSYILVQGDGTYYIGESVGGTATNFSTSFTPAIARGEAPNRISAECFDEPGGGVTRRLFVNGIPVNTVIDSIQPFHERDDRRSGRAHRPDGGGLRRRARDRPRRGLGGLIRLERVIGSLTCGYARFVW